MLIGVLSGALSCPNWGFRTLSASRCRSTPASETPPFSATATLARSPPAPSDPSPRSQLRRAGRWISRSRSTLAPSRSRTSHLPQRIFFGGALIISTMPSRVAARHAMPFSGLACIAALILGLDHAHHVSPKKPQKNTHFFQGRRRCRGSGWRSGPPPRSRARR